MRFFEHLKQRVNFYPNIKVKNNLYMYKKKYGQIFGKGDIIMKLRDFLWNERKGKIEKE